MVNKAGFTQAIGQVMDLTVGDVTFERGLMLCRVEQRRADWILLHRPVMQCPYLRADDAFLLWPLLPHGECVGSIHPRRIATPMATAEATSSVRMCSSSHAQPQHHRLGYIPYRGMVCE
jgi:hypothetical protein